MAKNKSNKLTLTYAETVQALAQLKGKLQKAKGDQDAARRGYDEADRAMTLAAGKEDFALAQSHKQARDEHQHARDEAVNVVRACQTERDELHAHAEALFKAANPFGLSSVTVNRVIVVDPESNDEDSAFYLDGDDNVQLSVGSKQLSREAYRVSAWAKEHGFLCFTTSQDVAM